MPQPTLYLASASPRRRELLEQLGLTPQVRPARLDETPLPGESAAAVVERLARAKADAVAAALGETLEPGVILAADTAVVLDGEALGKPVDDADALRMLRALSGREHRVMTGVHLRRTDAVYTAGGVETTRVRFRETDEALLAAYVRSGEARDKAGAYGIQGRGAVLIASHDGSFTNVVGLPLERLADWLDDVELPLSSLLDWT